MQYEGLFFSMLKKNGNETRKMNCSPESRMRKFFALLYSRGRNMRQLVKWNYTTIHLKSLTLDTTSQRTEQKNHFQTKLAI